MQTTASTTVTIVAPGFAVIANASVATPAAVTAMARGPPDGVERFARECRSFAHGRDRRDHRRP